VDVIDAAIIFSPKILRRHNERDMRQWTRFLWKGLLRLKNDLVTNEKTNDISQRGRMDISDGVTLVSTFMLRILSTL